MTDMPDTEADIWAWISKVGRDYGDRIWDMAPTVHACIEQVGGYVGESQPGSRAFKFGMSYGGLRMALIAAYIPFEQVVPTVWQKALRIPARKKTESKPRWKARLKAHAQQLFPRETVTLATADALLLAEYCRRKQEGRL